jgi:RNA ligase (TIGR02306 family)
MPWSLKPVEEMLVCLSQSYSTVILYGEVFGRSVQSLSYGFEKGKLGYRAFDLSLNGKYVNDDEFRRHCERFGVPTVPVLYRGPFSLEKINALADGKTTIDGADHIREGCVVKPIVERTDPKIGRVILKFIGTEYQLSKKDGDDSTDV